MPLNPMNHKRLSPTSWIQSRPRLLNAPFHRRKCLNGTNPRGATAAPHIAGFMETIAADRPVCPEGRPVPRVFPAPFHPRSTAAPSIVRE
jgi:hypothetical protein